MLNHIFILVLYFFERSETLTEGKLVRWYINKWTDYSRPIKLLNTIFQYLSKHWIVWAQQGGYDAVHDINIVSYF